MNINSILVVDDEAYIRDMLSEMLKDKAERIVVVESGSQALKILSREIFDIVLTDIKMPDMNGFQLLEYIKLIDPLVPIIMITGYDDVYDMQEALEKGVEEYVVKPFKKDEISVFIERAIMRSYTKRSKILQNYVSVANRLILQSDAVNKDELVIVGRRLIKCVTKPTNSLELDI